ncbi:PAS domain S-box protein [Salinirubellus salinus]|uniref:histidine kinase n=1 Tax=Salinirubellus salinus TaxID=1364945 RepID=A0A9E7R6W3_9EURY|nr:PAS domain S-box protein [Salinirubellus salinus]UWM55780.1 PAS domain S-box protein [Salinirubellus salinus]
MVGSCGQSGTVLCVDDDEHTLLLLAEHLDEVGLDPVTTSDPEEAVERAREPDVECVVSDYAMPEWSGMDLLEAVRQYRPNVPFVLFTGHGSESLASEALGAGATDYVLKDGENAYVQLRERVGRVVGEARAERTRRRYTKLLAESEEVVVVLSPDGVIEDVSDSVERVLGYRADTVTDTHFESYVHPDDVESVRERLERLLTDGGVSERLEFRVRHAGDRWITVETWAKDLVDDPDVDGVVTYLRDVTERADREAWVRALVENSMDVTSVVDPDGTVQYTGGSSVSVLGYESDELVGRRVQDFVHEDDLGRLESVVKLVGSPGTVAGPETYRFRGPDGEWRWVESVVSNPETDAVDGLVANTRDVGDRVERERALRRVESIVESMHDAAWTVDEDLRITYANRRLRERMGVSIEDIVGRQVDDPDLMIASEGQMDRYESMLRAVVDGEAGSRREQFTISLPRGDREIEIQASAISGADSRDAGPAPLRVGGAVCVSRDVTDRVETERRLERQNERLELLNHIVRHDIHNDMTIISGWLSLLREDVDPEVAERFEDVVRASEHVMELLQGVGEALSVVGTDSELSVKPTPLAAALQSEIGRVRDVHPEATVDVRGEVPTVDVLANEMLASVFRNLLVNAVTHARTDEPTVVVDTAVTDETATVTVTDEGPGLSEALTEALNDPDQLVAEASGVGVGLYLVETLVTAYDGDIEVRERDEGEGTVFRVSFRRADAPEAEGETGDE